jgi:hypothetical protein
VGIIGDAAEAAEPPPDVLRSPPGPPGTPTPTSSARVARLTTRQWEATVQDLLRLPGDTGLAGTFIEDPASGRFDNYTDDLAVGAQHFMDYQNAAEILAERVASDADAIARLVPADFDPAAPDAADRFIESFGLRAFRRPLGDAERASVRALFDLGPTMHGGDAFAAGVYASLLYFLQAPHFLYRIQRSDAPDDTGYIPLDDYEVAERLSYTLWNTMPDDALFEAAAGGRLTSAEGLAEQAARLLWDPRAKDQVLSFFHQVYEVEFSGLSVSASAFPAFTDQTGEHANRETQLFLEEMVWSREGSLEDILSTPETFVNDELAAIYGFSGTFGSDFERVDLDPTERSGLLTQIGFLARDSQGTLPSPIHRGVALVDSLFCIDIGPPPGDVPPLPALDPGLSNRERVEQHTETCGAGCHTQLINPIGFAFESFDALGQVRTEDEAGQAVDATGSFVLGGTTLSYDGVIEFRDAALATDVPYECYAQHWVEYVLGREPAAGDQPLIEVLAEEAKTSAGASARDILLELVLSAVFRYQAPLEEVEL